jgi:excisionase family DNA binding protein
METLTVANRCELLTVKEAAVRLRLHPMTVRRMIRDGRIPAVQLGGRGASIRVDSDELERLLTPKEPR